MSLARRISAAEHEADAGLLGCQANVHRQSHRGANAHGSTIDGITINVNSNDGPLHLQSLYEGALVALNSSRNGVPSNDEIRRVSTIVNFIKSK